MLISSDGYRITHLLEFESLKQAIGLVGARGQRAGQLLSTTNLLACVVTGLADSQDDKGIVGPAIAGYDEEGKPTYVPGWRWFPIFWRDERFVRAALSLLAERTLNAVIWVMGQYEHEELVSLEREGLIPKGVRWNSFSPRHSHSNVIVRLKDPNEVILPFHQGLGHFPGVRFAVFKPEDEPQAVYDEWVETATHKLPSRWDDLLTSDGPVFEGAAGYATPYGDENREHLMLASAEIRPEALVQELARRLGLPVITTRASEPEFRQWEWDYTLPVDAARALRAV
jgi:hypothetical protein